jgi:DNA primase
MILSPYDEASQSPLFITEGIFDAMSLQKLGFNATTCLSANISLVQMSHLKFYPGRIVIAFDNDEAGDRGCNKALKHWREVRMETPLYKVCCPSSYKDWNEAVVSSEPEILADYIYETIKPFDELSNLL